MPKKDLAYIKLLIKALIVSAIKYAYDASYRLFDTAQLYKNEAEVENALQELGLPREELFHYHKSI